MALTNIPAISPIYTTFMKGDSLTLVSIAFVALASFVSHLVENHKHGMPGLEYGFLKSQTISYVLNRIDVIGCYLALARFGYLLVYHQSYVIYITWVDQFQLALALALLCISEYDKYNPALKPIYIMTHSAWHVYIFYLMHKFLNKYIYI